MANGGMVTLQTRCTVSDSHGVPCGHIIKHFAMNSVPIIGEQAGKQIQDFIMALMNHLRKSHPQQFAEISNLGGTFMGFLSLRLFETMDPALHQSVAQFAAFLRSLVPAPPVTDAMIQQAVDSTLREKLAEKHTESEITSLCEELEPVVCGVVQRMRDYFIGILPPKKPEETGVPVA